MRFSGTFGGQRSSQDIRRTMAFRIIDMTALPRTESVWAYPRPPIVVPDEREVVVEFRGITLARTTKAVRVLETSHPPTFYIPIADVDISCLQRSSMTTHCEFKGRAAVLEHRRGRQYLSRRRVELSGSEQWVRSTPGNDRLLSGEGRSMHRRRGDRATTTRRLLWRLDHLGDRGPLQGLTRNGLLVITRCPRVVVSEAMRPIPQRQGFRPRFAELRSDAADRHR